MGTRLATAVAGLVAALVPVAVPVIVATPSYADHGGGPSAAAVAASKARVAVLERKVAAAAAAVDAAQSALDALRTRAEVAAEAYNRARVAQAGAEQALVGAQIALDAADGRVRTARSALTRFAVAAYEGGATSSVDVVLTAGRPDTLFYRLGILDTVARARQETMDTLRAASVFDGVVREQTVAMAQQARDAATAASTAQQQVQHAVTVQAAGVVTVTRAKNRLASMLTQARAHAGALERARLAAIARARAEAAAARRAAAERALRRQLSQPPSASPPSSFTGTVSAATEQAAVGQAESQIGKPYEWGAAGPDSYDCSGLVMWAYAQVGVTVDHWTGDQWNEGAHIPIAALRPGDLVFFATDTTDPNTIHHVGIYIGNAQMVEAPYTGANVRISDAFRPDLIGAVRLYNR